MASRTYSNSFTVHTSPFSIMRSMWMSAPLKNHLWGICLPVHALFHAIRFLLDCIGECATANTTVHHLPLPCRYFFISFDLCVATSLHMTNTLPYFCLSIASSHIWHPYLYITPKPNDHTVFATRNTYHAHTPTLCFHRLLLKSICKNYQIFIETIMLRWELLTAYHILRPV